MGVCQTRAGWAMSDHLLREFDSCNTLTTVRRHRTQHSARVCIALQEATATRQESRRTYFTFPPGDEWHRLRFLDQPPFVPQFSWKNIGILPPLCVQIRFSVHVSSLVNVGSGRASTTWYESLTSICFFNDYIVLNCI